MNTKILKEINQNNTKNKQVQPPQNMQTNKKNGQTGNKYNINYYNNMGEDEFEAFCKRLLILHKTGVYTPPPPKPRICNNKKRVQRGPRKYIPQDKKLKKTFGKGRVGVSCESFGVKNCYCCRPANEIQPDVRILRDVSQENKPLNDEQMLLSLMAKYSGLSQLNKYKSNKKTVKLNNKPVLEIDTKNKKERESAALKNKSIDLLNNYDEKIQNFLMKTEKYEKNLKGILATYTEDEVEFIDGLKEHDYCTNVINIDDENSSVPSTSFPKINNSVQKIIDEIILSDSDNDINESKENKGTESAVGINLPIELDTTNSLNTVNFESDDYTTASEIVVPYTSNSSMDNDVVHFVSNITIDRETKKKVPINKSSTTKGLAMIDCPICFESLENKEVMSTICGHIFCSQCIQNCIRKTKKCPNCRKKLTLKSIHPIFL